MKSIKLSSIKSPERNLKISWGILAQSLNLNKPQLKQLLQQRLWEEHWILLKKEYALNVLLWELAIRPFWNHQVISKYKTHFKIYLSQWKTQLSFKIAKFTNQEVGFQEWEFATAWTQFWMIWCKEERISRFSNKKEWRSLMKSKLRTKSREKPMKNSW